jgi:hypothetical protein
MVRCKLDGSVSGPSQPSWRCFLFKVLSGTRVAALLVLRPRLGLGTRDEPGLPGIPPRTPARWTRLHGRSFHGVSLAFTACPARLALRLSAASASRGIWVPSAHEERASPRPAGKPVGNPRWLVGLYKRFPRRSLRCRSRLSQPFSGLFLCHSAPPSFRRVTLVGFCLQGFDPVGKLSWLVAKRLPPDVFPGNWPVLA